MSAPAPWYEATALIASHVILLVDIGFSIYARLAFVTAVFMATIFGSSVYHSCQALNACLFGADVSTWRMIDHVIAVSNFVILFALLLPGIVRTYFDDREDSRDRLRYRDMLFWGDILKILVLFFIVIIVCAYTLTPTAFGGSFANVVIIVITAVIVAMFMYILAASGGYIPFYTNYDWRYLLPGTIIMTVAVVMFVIDIDGAYSYTHSAWHILSFGSFPFFIIGTQAYAFASLIRASCGCCKSKKYGRA